MPDEVTLILEEAAKRFTHAEVFEDLGETKSVAFENNSLKRVSAREFRGVGLRVIHDGRIGFSSTTDLRKPHRLVEMAAESVQYGQEAKFEFPGPEAVGKVDTHDALVGEVPADKLASLGREGLEMSLAVNPAYLFSCDVSTKTKTVRLMNTRGLNIEYNKSDMVASVGIQEVGEGGLLEVYEFKSSGHPFDSLTDITRQALETMRQASKVATAKAETVPIIFTPKALDNLLDPILTAMNGKLVHKGSSRLAGRIGEQIIDPRLSIIDDATVPHALASAPADGEGVPSRRLPLLENGVLATYLLDLQTAGLLGMKTTGSGHRSYASQPVPSATNVIVGAGTDSFQDMLNGLKLGLIADQTLGSGQSNTLAGEFSVNVSLGLLVENGKVTGRVKDCMIAGNVYDLLAKVEGISRERQWLGPSYFPAVCVGGIRLAVQNGA